MEALMMPGYKLNEYLLVLSPNNDLRARIIESRKHFNEKFEPTMPLSGKPHMALVRFVTWNMNEDKLVRRFEHLSMGVTPFKIELKDYGSFPTHTIFINVATKLPVQELIRTLKSTQRMMKAHPDHDPHFIQEPFIPIARKLLPWQYEKGWEEFSHLHFHARMIADGMLMLKRPLGEKVYQIVKRFEFRNLPVTTRQGELLFQGPG
ncbi:MAG TPA: 2'-5' RNA ligase family protein [Flavitalea sp.]|nr:2'-5' RNA ligase family protein [Flavitalea sp.]